MESEQGMELRREQQIVVLLNRPWQHDVLPMHNKGVPLYADRSTAYQTARLSCILLAA